MVEVNYSDPTESNRHALILRAVHEQMQTYPFEPCLCNPVDSLLSLVNVHVFNLF